ncbi:DNA-binding domain-containing protein [Variovorax sp. dw_308]|uniref:HvfC/BufC N-terminal domain-containing protein n=1 Tax=Variovorax sp. dw_308 TaxID=2721546 RepID=UPI001C44958D|nr:DNA-binding domain-containing protein [Variovorax sp. dw_308]
MTSIGNWHDLEQRQRNFGKALLHTSEPMPRGLMAHGQPAATARFNVYRNNVFVGLVEALKDAYPVVARLVGGDFFAAMARVHAVLEPPKTPVMSEYGAGFPDFIGGFESVATLPYLRDVASIERAWVEAYHAVEAAPMDLQRLAGIGPEQLSQLRFTLHPSLRVVRSRFPAFSIWRMNTEGDTPSAVDIESGAEDTLILRPQAEVEARLLPRGAAIFIEGLASGGTVAEAVELAIGVEGRFDLTTALVGLMETQALVDFSIARDDPLPDDADRLETTR